MTTADYIQSLWDNGKKDEAEKQAAEDAVNHHQDWVGMKTSFFFTDGSSAVFEGPFLQTYND